jgi:PAS domain S-box-containing protein
MSDSAMPASEVNEDVQAIVHATLLGDGWAATGLGSGIISEEGEYVACNDALCELTGYSRSELLQMNAGARLPADDAARKNFEEAASGARPWGFGHLRRKDGTVIGVNYWLIRTEVGSVPYFVVLLWADGSGPDLRTGPQASRAEAEELRGDARALTAQAEQQVRRADRIRRSREPDAT